MAETKPDTILVVDCGGQYAHLIARVIRRQHVFSGLVQASFPASSVGDHVKGIIISGGPSSVYEKNAPKPDPRLLELGIPVLGICYGHHYIPYALHGAVKRAERKEFGLAELRVLGGELLADLDRSEKVWMNHGDIVDALPDGFTVTASSGNSAIAAYENPLKKIYGVQFHPEVKHTEKGELILKRFVELCRCRKEWNVRTGIPAMVEDIRHRVQGGKAIIALSGGIDSATAALLAHRAIGDRLTAVYVDTGLMRDGETAWIREQFSTWGMQLRIVDAEKEFLAALRGIADPEEKRRVIGDLFVDIFGRYLGNECLIQGTIYPDRIESAQSSLHASRIKTHHNVGSPKIEQLRKEGRVIEPLRDLYKDEVREIAQELGLPARFVWRQPFPGPGLAARIEGEITRERVALVRRADAIVRDEVERAGVKPWQYFAVLTKSHATGIRGDARAFGPVIAVRIVESREAMTANFMKADWSVLERIATRIANEIPDITRVVYDITSKPPATIEWL